MSCYSVAGLIVGLKLNVCIVKERGEKKNSLSAFWFGAFAVLFVTLHSCGEITCPLIFRVVVGVIVQNLNHFYVTMVGPLYTCLV